MNERASLLQPPNQGELLPDTLPDGREMYSFKRGEGVYGTPAGECVGEYTGDRFYQCRPADYNITVRLLASGVGILATAAIMRVSPSTVIAVRNREGVSIKAEKANLSRRAHIFANVAFESAVELLLEVLNDPSRRGEASFKDVSDLIKAAGLATNTGQLLAGEATGRVEIPESKKPGHDDFNAELAKLRNVTATGLRVEKDGAPIDAAPRAIAGQNAASASLAPDQGARPDAPTHASTDAQSIGQTQETQ